MVNDSVSDVLTRIRNAQRAGHQSVKFPSCKEALRLLEVLKKEGFIESFDLIKGDGKRGATRFDAVDVRLKYYSTGDPFIQDARRVSKPGRRVYSVTKGLPKVTSGLGISIVSTSQGVMSDREARKRKIGGEVVAIIG